METTTTTYSDGSTTFVTNTTITNNSTGDSTTTTTVGGTGEGGTGTDPGGEAEEAEEHDKGSFADTGCYVSPLCKGDALQCAAIHQAWETKCSLQVPDSVEETTESDINAAVNSNGEGETLEERFSKDNPDNIFDVTEYMVDHVSVAGSCPADYTLNLLGTSFNVSWGYVCTFMGYIRPIVLAAAFFVGGLFFYNGLVRDF
jgi:hypothetical protein